MKYEEFKKELSRQIGINSKYFKPKENLILLDFLGTINEKDFEEQSIKNEGEKNNER